MKVAKETIVDIVRAYTVGDPDSLVVVVPKEARAMTGVGKGTKFQVKVDEQNRVIYEPLQ